MTDSDPVEELVGSLELQRHNTVETNLMRKILESRYESLINAEQITEQLLTDIKKHANRDTIDLGQLKRYLGQSHTRLDQCFMQLDLNKDNKLDFQEFVSGLDKFQVPIRARKARQMFQLLDLDQDGYISRKDWYNSLLLVPRSEGKSVLEGAYDFFVKHVELVTSEGDALLTSESLDGVGYFLAGGVAGFISRTCTAPFDRLKTFLIAQSGKDFLKNAAARAGSEASSAAGNSAVKGSRSMLIEAAKHIYRHGGVAGFFVGNGLNVIKVFPESAIKFGCFETAKRVLAQMEGARNVSDISQTCTFLAGGIAGAIAQLIVYPIDTVKFCVQCNAQGTSMRGLMWKTTRQMWKDGGPKVFYRGAITGLCGVFPYAAFDFGSFNFMKRSYLAREAERLGIEPSEVQLNNFSVMTIGAISGSVSASLVYPINLLRTRLQAQGTHGHPHTYTGLRDVYRKSVAKDGYKGLFRGLLPNIAKVAPAVSISYLVYENLKTLMALK